MNRASENIDSSVLKKGVIQAFTQVATLMASTPSSRLRKTGKPISLVPLVKWAGLFQLLVSCAFTAHAQGCQKATSPLRSELENRSSDGLDTDDILNLDLEQLTKVDVVVPSFALQVTSVARNESTVGQSPAAVFVITNEMIRRSGATSIPEVLRLVPGLAVAKVDSNKWAIGSRGFNGQFSNKLLVLIDGRSVYSPTFSGVNWDRQDTILEDIERIEVIRGPGASVWGANAVNGVVNILTKDSRDSNGTLATIAAGTELRTMNGLRYGSQVGNGWSYRLFAKHAEYDSGYIPGVEDPSDDWRHARIGFRSDWHAPLERYIHVTLQGELYGAVLGTHGTHLPLDGAPHTEFRQQDTDFDGGFGRICWEENRSETNRYRIQAYLDRRRDRLLFGDLSLDIFDVEFQHRFQCWDKHQLTWGTGYRYTSDQLLATTPFVSQYDPVSRQQSLLSGFIQDEISLIDDELDLMIGCKLEHNDFTGFEYQPSVRLLRTLNQRNVVWAAVSRAVRTPMRTDNDLDLRFVSRPDPLTFSRVVGNEDLEAEDLLALELGYRSQPNDQFSFDITAFLNIYSDLIYYQQTGVDIGLPSVVHLSPINAADANTFGTEVAAVWQVNANWKLSGWYSFINHSATPQLPGLFRTREFVIGNQAQITSSHDLGGRCELDAIFRMIGESEFGETPSYSSLDLRFAWKLSDHAELSLVGQNLLESHRAELEEQPVFGANTEVQRGLFGQLTLRR